MDKRNENMSTLRKCEMGVVDYGDNEDESRVKLMGK